MKEGGLLTEMSQAAAFSTWLSPMKLLSPPLHPTLFLHENHLGLILILHSKKQTANSYLLNQSSLWLVDVPVGYKSDCLGHCFVSGKGDNCVPYLKGKEHNLQS